MLRLNYAVDLRYGVLLDIAQKVWAGEAIDLTTGYLNCLWQGDANDMILRSFPLCASPAKVNNLTGPGVLSVRDLAGRLGALMQRQPQLTGTESETALLNNGSRLSSLLGSPSIPLDTVLQWTAHWVMQAGSTFGKPTHFDMRQGAF